MSSREAGRPTKYKEEYNEQVYKLCLLGATDEDLANFFNVCVRTVQYWKEKEPSFLHSIKRGKELADAQATAYPHARARGSSLRQALPAQRTPATAHT